jgi:hypothetical protein
MALRFPRGHAQTKKLIASCAAQGVGIDGLADVPSFRFVPAGSTEFPSSFTNGKPHGEPTKRGSFVLGKAKPKHLKNWTPCRTSADPMYAQPMAGDDAALTKARAKYADGKPELLRAYLAAQARERREWAELSEWVETRQLALAA